ncbi:hypothetical protein CAPTEDRAFT_176734 [Capitella teleta]|uniref:Vacuolar protein-sorting-associated protein 36 n=1 Tax=Capitella teleta TaxID=283909 RepID=R7VD55_CAPTE|nr:hypothetical protein CAPTEDRAFT_176734 [Capitella teleta]|eukprot:ELU13615.1 hypothetical protein CAPTEDRAFT_176734 [Capitella teleta]
MDRFAWTDGSLAHQEQIITHQNSVRLYDGDNKTNFDRGNLKLTSFRLIWTADKDKKCVISLSLSLVILLEEQGGGFNRSPKIILHLSAVDAYKPPGPIASSKHSFIKLSFQDGGKTEFYYALKDTLARRGWDLPAANKSPQKPPQKSIRTGIGGIEERLQQKHKDTDKDITQAFQDLSKLMNKAEEMVKLSKNLTQKIKDKRGEITDDETVQLKSYLLSLGVADPVTRETHGSGDTFYKELARQVSDVMTQPLQECGGIMPLSDVYCRMNRARGVEMLSPDDLVNACRLMSIMRLECRLQTFESGVMVLHLQEHSEDESLQDTVCRVESTGSLSADELARLIGLSVILSRERLLAAERKGELCRDDTAEGLRFYRNLFMTQ